MILSHRHRFIFIKGVKVAGTSSEIALSQLCGPDDIITPITPTDERFRIGTAGEPRNYMPARDAERAFVQSVAEQPNDTLAGIAVPRGQFSSHMPLSQVLALVPEASDYRLLFVERSPYEKVISQAHWRENRRRYEEGRGLPPAPSNMAAAVDRAIEDEGILKLRNIDRYRSSDGTLSSQGWRYERLATSLAAFLAEHGRADIAIPHAKRGADSARLDTASVLRSDQVAYINRAFEDEFRAFDYQMIG